MDYTIQDKVGRVLQIILLAFILILIRVWYLSIIQKEEYFQQSRKPQRRVIVEKVERGTIRDRFNIPLAINKIQYNAAVCYAQIREIPKAAARIKYVTELSIVLSNELNMSALEIEDTIYGKAALFPHTPFVIKEAISEKQYFKLKMLENSWPGIKMLKGSKRVYPQGKIASDVIGFLGTISQNEYQNIASELKELENYIKDREAGNAPYLPKGFATPLEVRERLLHLQEKSYTICDYVGKMGIEGAFDEDLRGNSGKKIYEVDTKGNILKELPGAKPSTAGKRIILSISSELQEYAEALLAQNESCENPWIKGGAIVALIPQTGEIVTLASYPRFDPNDFIPTFDPVLKKEQLSRRLNWIENETHIQEIWDGIRPLEKERFSFTKGAFYNQTTPLTWDKYLELALTPKSKIYQELQKIPDIRGAILFQKEECKKENLLLMDLCRMLVKAEDFSEELLHYVGEISLSLYKEHCQNGVGILGYIRPLAQKHFKETIFAQWRQEHFKDYLKEKRQEEKAKKRYAKPYTEYLDARERTMFSEYWAQNRLSYLEAALKNQKHSPLKEFCENLPPNIAKQYLKTIRSFRELDRPLLGKYKMLRSQNGVQLEKHLASAFYPLSGFSYGRSQAFRQSSPQGSVFKLVTSYEALRERAEAGAETLNPLTLIDEIRSEGISSKEGQYLGRFLNGEVIKRKYKGGILPRSHPNIGEIDITGALENSSNLYFAIIASDYLQDPTYLATATRMLGYGEKTGIELPGEIAGNIPNDLSHNKTGLYSFSIGQHSLVVTPLQTALMLSTIANHGNMIKPRVIKMIAGVDEKDPMDNLFSEQDYSLKEDLTLAGIQFPLFTEAKEKKPRSAVYCPPIEIKRSLFFPEEIRDILLTGMQKVITGPKGTARPTILRSIPEYPQSIRDYINMQNELVAKTGTAEILYRYSIDPAIAPTMENHVWFSGISFHPPKTGEKWGEPELVVVVYFRFGRAGKDGALQAAQIVKKWRELCAKHKGTSYFKEEK